MTVTDITEIIIARTAEELNLKKEQVAAVNTLAVEGCTIPFIARYRKERTGNLDEVVLDTVIRRLNELRELEKRRAYIIGYLRDQEKLTPALEKKLIEAGDPAFLEDLYLPFKPRRKTLADRAREQGLEPLARLIAKENLDRNGAHQAAENFIGDEVPDVSEALEGAMNIIVQDIADDAEVRSFLRTSMGKGRVSASVKRGKKESGSTYRDYFDFSEQVTSMASHRVMAILRAEKEGILNLSVESPLDHDILSLKISEHHFKKKEGGSLLQKAARLSLEKYLVPSIGKEVLKSMREQAETESVAYFSRNLEKILLAGPFGQRGIIGIDPGVRTGCKCVLLDSQGNFCASMTLNFSRDPGEAVKLKPWVEKHNPEGIAIGDGTYGRETYGIIKSHFKDPKLTIALVDEDGASVYSAGEEAREEFPDLDVTVRGAISIGRRFQDPMAELVKIDPRSLGVGQYQHDITPALLQEKLEQTVQWGVNRVGVNLNTAGYHLISYISGLDRAKARSVTEYRKAHGSFASRNELKKVKGIGDKAFQQSAGFLRIRGGKNPLDSTGVHPESYPVAGDMAEALGCSINELVENPDAYVQGLSKIAVTFPNGESIAAELRQRGLDPRREFEDVPFSDEITSFTDLKEGLVLKGIVDNVVAFGAFVDIGLKEKGLVHISEVSDQYVEDITAFLAVGDRVTVKVLTLDPERKRIGLSMKQA